MREKEREDLKIVEYQNAMIDNDISSALSDFKEGVCGLDFIYDLNDVTKDSKESLFTNYWIHCNARGNEMCAEYVYKILQQRGIIN